MQAILSVMEGVRLRGGFATGTVSSFPRARWRYRKIIVAVSMRRFGDWKDGEHGVIWESSQIAQAVGGTLRRHGAPGSICTDTRSLYKGEWFLALVGPNFDGNSFLPQALAAGCSGAIGRSMPRNWPAGFVEVPDALLALHKLASSVRERYTGHVVGITGSCGKTTTRSMTALALESLGRIHESQGNMNNHIGLPLTLLKLPSDSPAVVLEMGMNHSGEILLLSEIARPSVRVLINVGPVHIENFSSIEQVASAKGELLLNPARGDICVLNADDSLVMALPVPPETTLKLFGRSESSDVRLISAQLQDGGRAFKFALQQGFVTESVTCQVPGLHLAMNACAAACVATALGVPLRTAAASISRYSPVDMRARLESLNAEVQLINDAYNANPLSMAASLDMLASFECKGRKIVALGDMMELGTIAREAHLQTIKRCRELQVDIIGTAGPAFSEALAGDAFSGGEVLRCENSSVLAEELAGKIRPGDVVLVKGSRGMKMEVVVEAIKSRFLQGASTRYRQKVYTL